MEQQRVVSDQFGNWLKAGGRRGDGVGFRSGGIRNESNIPERQLVRVDSLQTGVDNSCKEREGGKKGRELITILASEKGREGELERYEGVGGVQEGSVVDGDGKQVDSENQGKERARKAIEGEGGKVTDAQTVEQHKVSEMLCDVEIAIQGVDQIIRGIEKENGEPKYKARLPLKKCTNVLCPSAITEELMGNSSMKG